MSCLKILGRLCLLKLISLIAVSFSSALYSHELDKTLASSDLKLNTKVSMALDLALKKFDGQKIWLIYTIDCEHTVNDEHNKTPPIKDIMTLEQIIWGTAFIGNDPSKENKKSRQTISVCSENASQISLNNQKRLQSHGNKNSDTSNLAIIYDYSLESGNPCLYHIYLQRMSQPFLSDNRPIFWLGREQSINSFEWLVSQFNKTKYLKLKQQIVSAIGIHNCIGQAADFLKQLVLNNGVLSLKEEAIYWLGQHDSIENIQFLASLAIKQNNIQLRKKAIFALSQIKDKKALAILTTLARREKNQEVRQEAIFWLSQIADDKSLNTLSEILINDENSAIKNYTVFAISQLPTSKATPILYHIANNNPDAQVRRKAKFWLDRTRDQRMLDFFMELVKEDERCGSN